MLTELRVANLGVIDELTVRPGAAMTAVTGETGAGKTLIVGAIALLAGGRADASMVRAGADEAVIDGRFEVDGEELVLTRVIPASGRSRAYRNGRPVTAAELAELGGTLIEIHGQHAHQQLLGAGAQRRALDTFGGIELGELERAAAAAGELRHALAAAGGLGSDRERQIDLLAFQLAELDDAGVDDPDEDDRLRDLEARLGDAGALRDAAWAALSALGGDGAARDRLAEAHASLQSVADTSVFSGLSAMLAGVVAEVEEVTAGLRAVADTLVDDPAQLAAVQQRRRVLTGLRRKYGATLAEVIAERGALRARHDELVGLDARVEQLTAELEQAEGRWAAAAGSVAEQRRAAAPRLADAVTAHLAALGMPHARVEVTVAQRPAATQHHGPDAGDDVSFLLAANAGSPALALAKVASGGELSRVMLALRLVLSGGPPVAVFDEVDAGIGGEAAAVVADALARVADSRQVLVVTHLAQVAARAGTHVVVSKHTEAQVTRTTATTVDGSEARASEVARMLSGSPDSDAAVAHARELLGQIVASDSRNDVGSGR